jgi:hypothetical protein
MQPILLREKATGKVLAQGVIWHNGCVSLEWQMADLPPDLGPVYYPSVAEIASIYHEQARIEHQPMLDTSEQPHQLVFMLTALPDDNHWHMQYADSRGFQGFSEVAWQTPEQAMADVANWTTQICELLDIFPVLIEEVKTEQEQAVPPQPPHLRLLQ